MSSLGTAAYAAFNGSDDGQSAISLEDSPDVRGTGGLGSDGMTYPVGFFRVSSNPDTGATVGGLLIADNTGIPLEFMVTFAVRPTAAQKVLYGKRLRSYIAVELCGRQLLEQIKTKPKVVFVEDAELLRLSDACDIPVLRLVPGEQLGTAAARPSVEAPADHPEFEAMVDLRSLDQDMVDCFQRVEQCREILAKTHEQYRV